MAAYVKVRAWTSTWPTPFDGLKKTGGEATTCRGPEIMFKLPKCFVSESSGKCRQQTPRFWPLFSKPPRKLCVGVVCVAKFNELQSIDIPIPGSISISIQFINAANIDWRMFAVPLNNSLMELLLLYGIGMEMAVCFAYLLAGRQPQRYVNGF